MSLHRKIVLFISLLLITSPLRAAEVVDKVVAVVGNELITLSDVKNVKVKKTGEDPLESLIREKIITSELERLNINASEEDIDLALKDVLTRNKISMDALRAELLHKGTSIDRYRKDLGSQIRQMKFMGQVIYPRLKISDDEITKKAGPNASEQARLQARYTLLQEKSPDEINRYIDEVRSKTFIEIKK